MADEAMAEETIRWFAGLDWGSAKHQACLLDGAGTVVGERAFAHGGAGLAALCDWLSGPPRSALSLPRAAGSSLRPYRSAPLSATGLFRGVRPGTGPAPTGTRGRAQHGALMRAGRPEFAARDRLRAARPGIAIV